MGSFAVSASLWLAPISIPSLLLAQASTQPARPRLDQVLGTVTTVKPADKAFTIKEDKTGTEYSVSAASARRFLKVPPGEKDLKKAQPITAPTWTKLLLPRLPMVKLLKNQPVA